MSKYLLPYCDLINSAEQIDQCRQANSLSDLLACIKRLWNCKQLSDNDLLCEIALLNQTPIQSSSINLVGNWLPYRYQPQRKLINWLIPIGHATEPFQDEYISRCRQQLVNQIIQPCTSMEFVLQQANKLTAVVPAGFIFHLSRCGSTLISGCISELDSTCVFSESPLLTELLLDNNLSAEQQKIFLRVFINLQAAAFSDRPQMIVKWNAWDIFRWEIIRDLYPLVPIILLVRDPVEILASHQRSAGRHMSGDLSLSAFHPVFSGLNEGLSLLGFRSEVLSELLLAMQMVTRKDGTKLVDYRQLNAAGLVKIIKYFGCEITFEEMQRIERRSHFHSKTPAQIFSDDTAAKKSILAQSEVQQVNLLLQPIYTHLFNNN